MGTKPLLAAALAGLLLLALAAPAPRPSPSGELAAFHHPELFRALSGPFHTLLADRLWLLSAGRAERAQGSAGVETDRFYQTAEAVILMDPRFFPAVNYASTFLASVRRDVEGANALARLALERGGPDIRLYRLMVVNHLAYREPVDDNAVAALAKEAAALPGFTAWFAEAAALARTSRGRTAIAVEELKALEKQARNEKEAAQIRETLEELEASL